MTVRTAELLMAIFLALASVGIMVKASDNYIFWVRGQGPGSGAWPFWLAALMLLACLWTIVRWFRRITPESRNTEPFMSFGGLYIVGISVAALILLLIGTYFIGVYFSLIAFLFFFIRIVGKNSWKTSIALSILIPIGTFIFFEWALQIPLPKGYSEPLFYPIYKIMY